MSDIVLFKAKIEDNIKSGVSSLVLPNFENRDQSLSSYISYVNSIPMLSLQEEVEFAKNFMENKDLEAANKLILSHLRVVIKIAFQFSRYKVPLMELIAEGNYGLVRAVQKFDYTKGFRFVTYAIWWIRAAIREYLANFTSVVRSGVKKIQDYSSDISLSNIDNISIDSEDMNEGIDLSNKILKIKKAAEKLSDREREIFYARAFEKNDTLEVLAKRFSISKERVRQIYESSLEKIKNMVS